MKQIVMVINMDDESFEASAERIADRLAKSAKPGRFRKPVPHTFYVLDDSLTPDPKSFGEGLRTQAHRWEMNGPGNKDAKQCPNCAHTTMYLRKNARLKGAPPYDPSPYCTFCGWDGHLANNEAAVRERFYERNGIVAEEIKDVVS